MNTHRKFLHWALGIGHWAFAMGVCAQTPSADSPSPPKLRFLFLDESPGAYSLKLAKSYQQLSAAPYTISPIFTPPAPGRIDLYKTNTTPDPVTGKIERVKIASFTPPADSTSTLVVVTPRPAPAGTAAAYGVDLIDSSATRFPLGHIRILNLGNVTMAAQFGTSRIAVQPGTSQILQPTADRRYRILAKIAAKTGEAWELRSDSLVILRPEQRVTGIFFYSPSGMIHTYPPDELQEHGPPPPGHFWLTYTDTP